MRSLHRPAMPTQPLTALDASSGNPAGDAPLLQIGTAARVVIALPACSFNGLRRGLPYNPLTVGRASMHFSNIIESCRFAPLTSATSEMPRASTRMCRLEPSLPLSVGLGPVSWPRGGLAPRSHRCPPGFNRSGHVRAGAPAWRGAVSATPRQRSSRAPAASRSCRCLSPGTEAGLPRRYRCAARTGCH